MSAKHKSQGMYPTPTNLARLIINTIFSKDKMPPSAILEPSAGFGVFAIEAWDYWKARGISNRQLNALIANTWLFENDGPTYAVLKANISEWCKRNNVITKPKIVLDNFLLSFQKHLKELPNDCVALGNPPWDEFTTRKHDHTGNTAIKRIREEREKEKSLFAPKGIKNLYQAFMHCLLQLKSRNLRLAFVLPRQILGDLASVQIRQTLLMSGDLELTVYKNKEEPQYYFAAVDDNFEIAVLQYVRRAVPLANAPYAWIRRGFSADYLRVAASGEDLTIPCPPNRDLAKTLAKLLGEGHLGSWSEKWGISISRGKITSESPIYSKSVNGRTIHAYQVSGDLDDSRLVLNKILPNSKRKLKAAILPTNLPVSDSMVMVDTINKSVYPYLVLMINSRAVELALRSLTTNINLNNFRLLSLPIPEPQESILKKAEALFKKCRLKRMSWEEASDHLTKEVFSLNLNDQAKLQLLYPERNRELLADDQVAA